MQKTLEGLMRAEECAALAGVSMPTWYRQVRRGHTPRPVRISKTVVRWKAAEIRAWVAAGCPVTEKAG